MTTFRDHKVRYLTREDIAKTALSWWKIAERRGRNFNICEFVVGVLTKRFRGKGTLKVEFHEPGDLPERACVTFDPLTLHIDRNIWNDANIGKPYARFIVAHEIGHIILHDRFAIGFSDDDAAVLPFIEKEESAEMQANAFADLFLVPDHVALQLKDCDSIVALCVVEDRIAERRFREARDTKHPIIPTYEGEVCSKCNRFSLTRVGILMKCDTCGNGVAST